jgi:hypothetical protein
MKSSRGQETWYLDIHGKRDTWTLDRFPWTGNVVPGHSGQVPIYGRHDTWTDSHGQETLYLDNWQQAWCPDSAHGEEARYLYGYWTSSDGHQAWTRRQVPMEKKHGTWKSSHGQMAGNLDKFPWTEDVVQYLDKCQWMDRRQVPKQAPMDRRRVTVPGHCTSFHVQKANYWYLDKFPWTGGVAQNCMSSQRL